MSSTRERERPFLGIVLDKSIFGYKNMYVGKLNNVVVTL